MNKITIIPASLVIVSLLVSVTQADTSPPDSYSLSTKVDTLGSGFDLSYGISNRLRARLSLSSQPKSTIDTYHHSMNADMTDNFSLVETDSIKLKPYLGLGWKDGVKKDNEWHFRLDAGVLFGSSETVNAMPIAIKNSDDLQPLPVISLETSYRF